ncbi:SMI1/KNR4 family protein [Janthinobacterium sp. JC611]|uniref:SMI1/KNR4 family protein n=1 Tax=Janthinobacterium sp. JC611 TaxID=2816201 RepID=UPI001BFE5E28|nr:SMI1/KNR4 family protein [Janthinobacterium sp. JC611]
MKISFLKFKNAFPKNEQRKFTVDTSVFSLFSRNVLGVDFPADLVSFFDEMGGGYFGENDLYFFCDGKEKMPRDSFQEWNEKDFWRDIFPSAADGGPVFFAETSFGDQIGYRMVDGDCIYILFLIDTFESFVIAENGSELFERVLTERFALVDERRLIGVEKNYGRLKEGMHFAPIVSPMLGGKGNVENFCLETPNVHFRTAIATFKSIQKSGS